MPLAMEKQLRIIGFIIDVRNGPESDINYVPFWGGLLIALDLSPLQATLCKRSQSKGVDTHNVKDGCALCLYGCLFG